MTKKKTDTNELELALARELQMARAQGQCADVYQGIPGKLLLTEPTGEGWGDLALMLSLNLPGQFWVGSNSICWVNGAHSLYLAPEERLQSILDARAICAQVTGMSLEQAPCSAAGVARKLLAWCGIRQMTARALDSIGAQDSWSYQYCDPVDLPFAYLHDITSCYYELLRRAPSPKVILVKGKLYWCPIDAEERRRWDTILKASAPHKGVRNSFIGQMYASGDGLFYAKGKPNKNNAQDIDLLRAEDGVTLYQTGTHLDEKFERTRPEERQQKPGPLRPLACLVVRSAYELCAIAREETEGFYANTDCVITKSERPPAIWNKYGLKVALKGAGEAHIHAIGYYRVGEKETKPYQAIQNKPRKRPRLPSGQDPETTHRVKLILSGQTWCNQWLEVSR